MLIYIVSILQSTGILPHISWGSVKWRWTAVLSLATWVKPKIIQIMVEVELTPNIFSSVEICLQDLLNACLYLPIWTMSGCPQHWVQATEVFLYGQRLVLATDLPHHRHHQQQPLLSLSPQSKIHPVKYQVSNLLLCVCFLADISLQKSEYLGDYALLILLWCVGSHLV